MQGKISTKIPDIPDRVAIPLIILMAFPVLYFSLFVPFETDTGDSVVHYFFARYAFDDPMLLLDHWAKPFFTLLASPFAQFGFEGMKLFNGIVGLLSAWLAYKVARKLDLKFAWLGIIFVLFAPSYFVKLFSGYTEPLFGVILVASVYFVLAESPLTAAVLISFLPFVRSEGLIIIVVFALYFLLRKNIKATILLSAGHIIYSIAGLLAGKSMLWMFTEIPYHVISVYGKGDFAHYPTQLLLTLGIPVFLLACAGIVVLILDVLKVKTQSATKNKLEVRLLILGSFLAYFLFHTFSWGLGLFASMGMSRVLTAMVPLLSVIALFGFNYLIGWGIKGKFPVHVLIAFLLIAYVLVFPFLHNPASINWNKELRRSPEMNLMHTIANDINKHEQDRFLYYSNPYFSYALGINPFDRSKHLCFTDWQAEKKLKPNSLVIWDNWFSITEERTDSIALFRNPELKLISRYETEEDKAKKAFLVFGN
jgi:hypothetical protein